MHFYDASSHISACNHHAFYAEQVVYGRTTSALAEKDIPHIFTSFIIGYTSKKNRATTKKNTKFCSYHKNIVHLPTI